MNFTEEELLSYLASFLWPFCRISSMFISLPVFGITSVSAPIKVVIGFLITLLIFPSLPAISHIETFSFAGLMVTLEQIALGFSAGFILQMVFTVMMFAGQMIAYSMGLGFASMVDPTTGVQVPVIAQLFMISSSLLFLSIDGHLLVIEMLAESFHTLPVTLPGFDKHQLWQIIAWSSQIFADGVLLALPLMATLLFINISFGVASKAAPQLQIFGVGFPTSIILGMVLVWLGLPSMLSVFSDILRIGFELLNELFKLN